ncbi:MAG: hypothetical protein ACNFW9_06145 [Candidatus Kerfeldbacteria bacterium]
MHQQRQTIVMMILILIVALLWTANGFAASPKYTTKLLMHSVTKINDNSNVSIAGWTVLPNPGSSTYLAVVGPRYDAKRWSVEAMGGLLVVNEPVNDTLIEKKGHFIADIRASLNITKQFCLWGNVEYVPDNDYFYLYLEADYSLPIPLVVGAEIENDHILDAPDNLSIGGHIKVPFKNGKFVMMAACQRHYQPGAYNQISLRGLINF